MPLNLQERPIFMIGAERSGTTLVMALLGCHSRIAVPEVVWYYPRFYPYLHTYGDLSVEANFRTLAQEIETLAALTVEDANAAFQTMLLDDNCAYVQINPQE